MEAMSIANSPVGLREFLLRIAPRLACNEANDLIFIFGDQGFGRRFQLDGSDAQLRGSKGSRDERRRDDCQDENRRNLQALGTLINVQHRGVREGYRDKEERPA